MNVPRQREFLFGALPGRLFYSVFTFPRLGQINFFGKSFNLLLKSLLLVSSNSGPFSAVKNFYEENRIFIIWSLV
jgi:hypothetical protein